MVFRATLANIIKLSKALPFRLERAAHPNVWLCLRF